MIIAGIDYSLNSPGICVYDTSNPLSFNNCQFYLLLGSEYPFHPEKNTLQNVNIAQQSSFESEIERYYNLAKTTINRLLDKRTIDLAVIEGYSYNAKGRIFNISEATGILKEELWLHNIETIIVPPTQSKKNFTGNGTSNKQAMIKEMYNRCQFNISRELGYAPKCYGSPISDIVDSYALVDYYMINKMGNKENDNTRTGSTEDLV